MPYQASATRSTPLSSSVGASGRNGERVSLPTAENPDVAGAMLRDGVGQCGNRKRHMAADEVVD